MSRPSCLIYDLYLDTLGGGERVIFAVAEALQNDFEVTVAAPHLPERSRLAKFGMNPNVAMQRMHPARFTAASRRADLVVYLANGVPMPSLARRSLLFLQFPFNKLSRSCVLRSVERRVLAGYQPIVYSEFVAHWARCRLAIDPVVLHPPAQLGTYDASTKEPLILSIGRFFSAEHTKRHDVLIEAHRRLPRSIRDRWPLVLAGGLYRGDGGTSYLDRLHHLARGDNVRFEVDVSDQRLRELLSQASLFWHATGFGRDSGQPEKAEHFGLSTIEAMSWGAVPLVYADGGQLEIVSPGTGVLWQSIAELVQATQGLIDEPARRLAEAKRAAIRALDFDPSDFQREIRLLAQETSV